MDDKFRDFIPAGEDTGAIGEGGFQDYVPAPTPKPQVIEEVKPVEVVKEPEVEEEAKIEPEPIVPPLDEGGSQ